MAGTQLRRLGTALFAMAVSIALICGHALGATGLRPLVGLVNTVIGVGGSKDPLSERLPAKLQSTVVPSGYSYIGTEYPASLNLDRSVRIGMPVLHQELVTTSGTVLVAGYSLGALLVEQLKRDVAGSPNPPSPSELSFLQIATPFVPNGGIFARFPGIAIPNVVSPMGPGQPTQYDTTYIVNEYDLWGDFPAYFNPVSILNAVLGHEYAHVDKWYDAIDPADPANLVKSVTDPDTGGTETYILVPATRLPLLGPLRDIAYHLGISPVAERLLGAIEPLLRVIVDMGYTDRLNLNPEKNTPFSLFTPPHKIAEALRAVPGAIEEGLHNLVHGPRTPEPAPEPATGLRSVPTATEPEATTGTAEPEADQTETEIDKTEAVEEPEEVADAGVTVKKTPRTVPTVRSPYRVRTAVAPDRSVGRGPKKDAATSSDSGQDDRDAGAEAA
ncbi:PE-PPE domain-containing protein [Mycolicibacterium bacteremicum]|nr:PE-PPE domain-containing protein [Mycolicibacterium bacteremicum]MCV7430114.1 PE-PPE domain-containing protein [Mycolicibacterium bacteremicum]